MQFCESFSKQFNDFLIYILIAGAVISIALEIYEFYAHDIKIRGTDAIVIGAIIIANAIIGFIQEGKADEAIEALRAAAAPQAQVLRDGVEKQIFAREIVPGDIIILQEGSQIPADGRLFEAVNLKIDEAVLTGESTPVKKFTKKLESKLAVHDQSNMAFKGTYVLAGAGKAVGGRHNRQGFTAMGRRYSEFQRGQTDRHPGGFRSGLKRAGRQIAHPDGRLGRPGAVQ